MNELSQHGRYLIDQYQKMHLDFKYGITLNKLWRVIKPVVKSRKPLTILDYGCGQNSGIDNLKWKDDVEIYRYDPAISEYSEVPVEKVDMLINIDVLEHIALDDIDCVLGHMRSFSTDAIFNVATRKCKILLPNGQNVHCTVRDMKWWIEKISQHYHYVEVVQSRKRHSFMCKTWGQIRKLHL